MAVLPEIRQTAFISGVEIGTSDVSALNDDSDATYIESLTGNGVDGQWRYSLNDTPEDFQSMDTYTITLRAYIDITGDDTWNIRAFIADSAGNAVSSIPAYQVVDSTTVQDFVFNPSMPSTNTKAAWDDYHIIIDYQNVKNMSPDGNFLRITRSGITGTYTLSATSGAVLAEGTGSVSISGSAISGGAVSTSGTADTSIDGYAITSSSVSVSADGSVAIIGTGVSSGSILSAGDSSVTISGARSQFASISIDGEAQSTIDALAIAYGVVDSSGTATTTIEPTVISGAAGINADGSSNVSISGYAISDGAVDASGVGTVDIDGQRYQYGNLSIDAEASVVIDSGVVSFGQVEATADSEVTISSDVTVYASQSMSATASVDIEGVRYLYGSLSSDATSTVVIEGQLGDGTYAQISWAGESSVSIKGIRTSTNITESRVSLVYRDNSRSSKVSGVNKKSTNVGDGSYIIRLSPAQSSRVRVDFDLP